LRAADSSTRLSPGPLQDAGGQQYTQASVMITLDNSDGRFPVDSASVVLGRTVGLKKDEYFSNSKPVKKSDIINMLESAGFSRSNPYYIIAQGKVDELTRMSNQQRLELIKNVAGTQVYQDKRADSLALLDESDAKRVKINEVRVCAWGGRGGGGGVSRPNRLLCPSSAPGPAAGPRVHRGAPGEPRAGDGRAAGVLCARPRMPRPRVCAVPEGCVRGRSSGGHIRLQAHPTPTPRLLHPQSSPLRLTR
jgi:hypothetical protein